MDLQNLGNGNQSRERKPPHKITTQWVPLRGDNYIIRAIVVSEAVSYCSSVQSPNGDNEYCKNIVQSLFVPFELGYMGADLVVLGDLKGIMHDLRLTDRFDADAKLAKIPVNLNSVVQVTVKSLRWPVAYPSFLNFEICDSKGKLIQRSYTIPSSMVLPCLSGLIQAPLMPFLVLTGSFQDRQVHNQGDIDIQPDRA